jgi:hypothetical protein
MDGKFWPIFLAWNQERESAVHKARRVDQCFFFFNLLMELGWQQAPLCGFGLNWQLYFKELLKC